MGLLDKLRNRKRSNKDIRGIKLEGYFKPGVFDVIPSKLKGKRKKRIKKRKHKKDEYELSRERVKNLIK